MEGGGGMIEFQNVSFSYQGSTESGLTNISLTIPDGQCVLLCGQSGGGHLSGGERQRISIARAMLKHAPIVILDEATAYTDPENEALIQESVARLVKGKTLIVIAHRLSTIVDADQIVVVNDGRIEAAGTQTELLQTCPLYQDLWNAHLASRDSAKGGAGHA